MRVVVLLILLAGCRQILGLTDPPGLHSASLGDGGIDGHTLDTAIDAVVPNDQLVLHFAFDDLVSNTTPDSSDRMHVASCSTQTCPTLTAGHDGKAVRFISNGGLEYFTIPASPDFAFASAFTIAFWIDLQNMQKSCAFTQGVSLEICINANRQPELFSGLTTVTATNRLQVNTFTHVAVTFASGTLTFFIAGQRDSVQTFAGPGSSNSQLTIGSSDSADPLDANLDELYVYARALDDTEIAKLASE